VIGVIHRHKWGNVKLLGTLGRSVVASPGWANQIMMLFSPRGVVHLGDDRGGKLASRVLAEKQIQRAKIKAEVSQLREQVNRTRRDRATLVRHQLFNPFPKTSRKLSDVLFRGERNGCVPVVG